MGDRARIRLPMGNGLDRLTGPTVAEPSDFRDLRNVELYDGRMEVRKGLARVATFPTNHTVVAVHPCRSRAKGAVLTAIEEFAGTKSIYLWITDPDGTDPVSKGVIATVYTVDGAHVRFTMADAYDRLFIAHDEPDLGLRCTTAVYNFATDSAGETFYTDEALASPWLPAFRGVTTWLNHLVAWGYNTTDDPDRAEIVRMSIPANPLVFDPQHYFLAGIRGDAVIGCCRAGNVLKVRKGTETYRIEGHDRSTFGIFPDELEHGLACSRLHVTVGSVNYFWSAAGPRRDAGGVVSDDLALPLALLDPAPDALAATLDTETAFAVYDPTRRVILFIFGQWAFALHLSVSPPRWSYRQYAVALGAGAVLWESTVGTVTSGAPDPAVLITFDGVTPIGTVTQDTIEITADIAGTPDAADAWEAWVKQADVLPGSEAGALSGYRRVYREIVPGATVTKTLISILRGSQADLALRIKRGGVPGAVYASDDPTTWPAGAQHTAVVVPINAPTVTSCTWAGNGAGDDTLTFVLPVAPVYMGHVVYQVEVSDGAGGWVSAAITANANGVSLGTCVVPNVNAYAGLTRDVRIRHHTSSTDSAWTTVAGVVFV